MTKETQPKPKQEKIIRHIDNVQHIDKCWYHGNWWERGVPKKKYIKKSEKK